MPTDSIEPEDCTVEHAVVSSAHRSRNSANVLLGKPLVGGFDCTHEVDVELVLQRVGGGSRCDLLVRGSGHPAANIRDYWYVLKNTLKKLILPLTKAHMAITTL